MGDVSFAAERPSWRLRPAVAREAGLCTGVAATVGILIAGQLLMGAAIDRWGLFGSTKIPLHWPRVLGIVLLGAGAALSLKK